MKVKENYLPSQRFDPLKPFPINFSHRLASFAASLVGILSCDDARDSCLFLFSHFHRKLHL